jgi:hypothetical protein
MYFCHQLDHTFILEMKNNSTRFYTSYLVIRGFEVATIAIIFGLILLTLILTGVR